MHTTNNADQTHLLAVLRVGLMPITRLADAVGWREGKRNRLALQYIRAAWRNNLLHPGRTVRPAKTQNWPLKDYLIDAIIVDGYAPKVDSDTVTRIVHRAVGFLDTKYGEALRHQPGGKPFVLTYRNIYHGHPGISPVNPFVEALVNGHAHVQKNGHYFLVVPEDLAVLTKKICWNLTDTCPGDLDASGLEAVSDLWTPFGEDNRMCILGNAVEAAQLIAR